MPPQIILRRIEGFRLVTQDSACLARFYQALGFVPGPVQPIRAEEMALLGLGGGGARLPLTLGGSRVEVDCFEQAGRPYPKDADAADLVFQHLAIVTDNAARAWENAQAAGATPISRTGPITLPASSGGVVAIKFRDPDGHPLELLQFPKGANADWPGTGMLGIDHSAISVGDVGLSLNFYAAHGLVEGQRTLNQGPTQTALDGVDGADVDVVPMLPEHTPAHLELLGYRTPRAMAHKAAAPNDIAATRIVWAADRDALLRDPDGHLHQLVTR